MIFCKKNKNGLLSITFRNLTTSVLTALVIFALSGFKIKVSTYTIILSCVFGIVMMVGGIVSMKAYQIGPYGYTQVMCQMSTIITALSGTIFWHESFGVPKIIGITLMTICFILAVDHKQEGEEKKANILWFILTIITMLTNASIGLLQKVHQSSEYKSELLGFLVISFLFNVAFNLVWFINTKKKHPDEKIFLERKGYVRNFFIFVAISGIVGALNHCINLYLSGVVDSAIMFPIVNGIPLMGGIIVSFTLFKERLSKRQIIGLIIGIIAVATLCI